MNLQSLCLDLILTVNLVNKNLQASRIANQMSRFTQKYPHLFKVNGVKFMM